jgi:hypothetical protein
MSPWDLMRAAARNNGKLSENEIKFIKQNLDLKTIQRIIETDLFPADALIVKAKQASRLINEI